MEILTDDNFLIYAARHYDNPHCQSTDEFLEDLNRFRYIQRLVKKYRKGGELRINLLLNHVVILGNLFGVSQSIRMLYLKCQDAFDIIIPILIFLGICPDYVENVNDKNKIYLSTFTLDTKTIEELRRIRG